MTAYPDRHEACRQLIEVGRQLADGGYVVANDGNMSCMIGPDLVVATPTGVSKGSMTGDMFSVLDLDGNVVLPGSLGVSSEIRMHLRVYRENKRVRAVVHAHPVTATAFAAAGIPLDDSILTESVTAVGSLPVARFAVPGTKEVPESIAPFCNEYNGALLANHGVITWGESLGQAFFRLQWAEQTAKVTLITRFIIGHHNTLSKDQVSALEPIRENLGIEAGGRPVFVESASNDRPVMPRRGLVPDPEDDAATPMAETIVRRVTERVMNEIMRISEKEQGDKK